MKSPQEALTEAFDETGSATPDSDKRPPRAAPCGPGSRSALMGDDAIIEAERQIRSIEAVSRATGHDLDMGTIVRIEQRMGKTAASSPAGIAAKLRRVRDILDAGPLPCGDKLLPGAIADLERIAAEADPDRRLIEAESKLAALRLQMYEDDSDEHADRIADQQSELEWFIAETHAKGPMGIGVKVRRMTVEMATAERIAMTNWITLRASLEMLDLAGY